MKSTEIATALDSLGDREAVKALLDAACMNDVVAILDWPPFRDIVADGQSEGVEPETYFAMGISVGLRAGKALAEAQKLEELVGE